MNAEKSTGSSRRHTYTRCTRIFAKKKSGEKKEINFVRQLGRKIDLNGSGSETERKDKKKKENHNQFLIQIR